MLRWENTKKEETSTVRNEMGENSKKGQINYWKKQENRDNTL